MSGSAADTSEHVQFMVGPASREIFTKSRRLKWPSAIPPPPSWKAHFTRGLMSAVVTCNERKMSIMMLWASMTLNVLSGTRCH